MMQKIVLKFFISIIFFLIFPNISRAAYNNFVFHGDKVIENVAGTNGFISDLIISNGSTAEGWMIDHGLFQVILRNGSSFKVKSSNPNTKSILYEGSLNSFCTNNISLWNTEATATGDGTYTIKPQNIVCLVESPQPGFNEAENKPIINSNEVSTDQNIAKQILNDAAAVFKSGTNLNAFIEYNKAIKNTEAQRNGMEQYIKRLTINSKITINNKYAINNFIIYGTLSTRKLSEKDRFYLVASYQFILKKLPIKQTEWEDMLRIAIAYNDAHE
ncbi:MAG: hypothetical protein NT091_04795 [Candidatus Falkowbacteria bacterium]|nr:hypothetical protein [Candidatus Falkowbacteria bacterium]